MTRSDLLQASRYIAFGRLRNLPARPIEESDNPFVDIDSKRTLGNDSISPMVSTWIHKNRIQNAISTFDEKFSPSTKNGNFSISVKGNKESISDLWLAVRGQII